MELGLQASNSETRVSMLGVLHEHCTESVEVSLCGLEEMISSGLMGRHTWRRSTHLYHSDDDIYG